MRVVNFETCVLSVSIVVSIRHSLVSFLEAYGVVKQPGNLLCRSESGDHEADRCSLFGCAKQVVQNELFVLIGVIWSRGTFWLIEEAGLVKSILPRKGISKESTRRTWSYKFVEVWLAMAAGAFASTSYCTVPTAAREGFSTKRQAQQQRHSHEATGSNQSLRSSFKGEKVSTSGMLATNDLSALKARRAVANNSNRKILEISAVLAEFPKETVVSPKLPKF